MQIFSSVAAMATLSAIFFLSIPALAGNAHTTGTVNLRSGPGMAYGRITTLSSGIEAQVSRCQANWCHIDTGEVRGWVAERYLDQESGAVERSAKHLPGLLGLPHRPYLGPGPVRSPYFNPRTWPGSEL